MLIYRCPKSGQTVRTSIQTSMEQVRRLSSFKLSLWCPHCNDAHVIFGKDAEVSSEIASSSGPSWNFRGMVMNAGDRQNSQASAVSG
jgi:hypothetical protein